MTDCTVRRTAALIFFALAVPAAALGQDVGIKAGATSANLTVKSTNPIPAIGPRIGGVGGVYGTHRFSSFLGLEIDVLFAIKGAKSKSSDGASFSFSYFTVPLLARLKISGNSPVRVYLTGGPELGYRVQAKLVSGGDSVLFNDFVKIYDLGGSAGGCAEFGRFSVDVRYTRGLIDISRNDPTVQIRNRTVTGLFGVKLSSK